jgi:DNA-binding NtrC family response regulator
MIEEMQRYHWPGNIRELKSFVESYFILLGNSREPNLDLFSDLLSEYTNDAGMHTQKLEKKPSADTSSKKLKDRLHEYEKVIIAETLRECEFSKTETAKRLGISVNTLWRKLHSPHV